MLKQLTFLQSFHHFVSMRDPEERYQWRNPLECPCGRYINQVIGVPIPAIEDVDLSPEWDEAWQLMYVEIPGVEGCYNTLNTIAMADDHEDWTYGKLRMRLELLIPECVV